MSTAIDLLSEWAAALRLDDIPPGVRAVARNCLIDTIGVALAGSGRPVTVRMRRVAEAQYAGGGASVLGTPMRLGASGAALVNGTAAHALDFDDNCYAGFVHGSAVVVPAALAVAQAAKVSGKALLAAFVAGAEAEFAIGEALTPNLYEKGWWTTGVLGPIGASVAAGHALGLDAGQIASALGIAVAGTGGAKSCFGTDAKPMLCGRAAEAGVVAALLAAAGASGPRAAFEDQRGCARLVNDGIFKPEQVAELGRAWRLLTPGIDIKRIPVCLSSHTAVDALIDILHTHRVAADDVAEVMCDVGPVVANNLVYPDPRSPQQAQFSLEFALACVLTRGDVALGDLEPGVLDDPTLRAAMRRIRMTTGERWAAGSDSARDHPEGAHVTVTTRDGRKLAAFWGSARGTARRPLGADEIAAKFTACAGPVAGAAGAARLLDRLRNVEEVADVSGLLAA